MHKKKTMSTPLVPLPSCQLFKEGSTEFSSPNALYCVAEHFSTQITEITGATTLGGIVQYFRGMTMPDVQMGLQLLARNGRANERDSNGYVVPEVNARVMTSLVGLLDVARSHPQCFSHHPQCKNRLTEQDMASLKKRWGPVCKVQRAAKERPASDIDRIALRVAKYLHEKR